MDIDAYQTAALERAIYPGRGSNLTYPTLGMCGEAGEFAEKLKKCLRDDAGILSPETRAAMVKELGDVMWYVAAIASELGLPLSEVAEANLEKTRGRHDRGTLHGSGDDR